MCASKNLQALSRRGLHSTAVEVARLLYALDPEHDPRGALLYLDYLALRAKRYALLETLTQARPDEAPAPSLAFSLALGRFLAAREGSGSDDVGCTGPADEALMRAVLMYPGLVVRLMTALRVCGWRAWCMLLPNNTLDHSFQEQGVGRDAMWDGVLKHALFAHANNNNASLVHLYDLFVQRHAALWKVC